MESSKGSSKSAASKSSGSSKAADSKSKGQKVSSERGSATNNKKNPGSRAHQGGSSR